MLESLGASGMVITEGRTKVCYENMRWFRKEEEEEGGVDCYWK